jgi:hypothetical protein
MFLKHFEIDEMFLNVVKTNLIIYEYNGSWHCKDLNLKQQTNQRKKEKIDETHQITQK